MKNSLLLCAAIGCAVVARAEVFQIDLWTGGVSGLSGLNQSTPNESTASGDEIGDGLYYDDASNLLTVNVAYGMFGFAPLTGSYVASHLHEGLPGVDGPIALDLDPLHNAFGQDAGFYTGTVSLSEAQESSLLSGGLYMNVHSTTFSAGEIRGQLVVIPEPGTLALMTLGAGALLWFRRRAV
ncbi:MAG: CHRD domain-containing protein [Limisphaerales bacterium]